jgi:hypothetical protein
MVHAIARDGGNLISLLDFHNDEEKEIAIEEVRHLFQQAGVAGYCTIAEAWLSTRIGLRPSKDPERIEVVVIGTVSHLGKSAKFFRICRWPDGSYRRLKPMPEFDGLKAGGMFMELIESEDRSWS